jgi:hypothetical protein
MSSRGKSDEFRNGFDTNSVEFEARKKFPYPPQDIVVEKRFGKRTAAGFCSFRAAKTGSTSRSKSNSINESEKSEMSASSALNLSCDSDHSDTLSFVSDLSELSMLSDVRFDHPRVQRPGPNKETERTVGFGPIRKRRISEAGSVVCDRPSSGVVSDEIEKFWTST